MASIGEALLETYRPEVVAVEEVFYSVNAKSALKLGHVRGVALLAAATHIGVRETRRIVGDLLCRHTLGRQA